MPPAPLPKPSPGGPKQMPKWAWPVAIGGGLLIGFFLLRKPTEEYEDEQEEESPYPEGQKKGGGGGGSMPFPFPEGIVEAFGLTPPTWEYQGNGTGESGGFDDSGESAVTSDSQTSLAGLLPPNLFYNPTTPVGVGAPNVPSPGGGGPTSPVSQPGWGGTIPTPSPSPPSSGGGSGSHVNLPQ